MNDAKSVDRLVERLLAIGIEIKLAGNYPWVYLSEVNGVRVREKRSSDYGFTLCYHRITPYGGFKFLDLKETFKIIRKYAKK